MLLLLNKALQSNAKAPRFALFCDNHIYILYYCTLLFLYCSYIKDIISMGGDHCHLCRYSNRWFGQKFKTGTFLLCVVWTGCNANQQCNDSWVVVNIVITVALFELFGVDCNPLNSVPFHSNAFVRHNLAAFLGRILLPF